MDPFVCSGEPLILVEGDRDKAVLDALRADRGLPPFQVYVYRGPVFACMKQFFTCLRESGVPHQENGKSRLHVLLAAEPIFRGALQYHAAGNFVPVGSAVFNEVVQFLQTVTAA